MFKALKTKWLLFFLGNGRPGKNLGSTVRRAVAIRLQVEWGVNLDRELHSRGGKEKVKGSGLQECVLTKRVDELSRSFTLAKEWFSMFKFVRGRNKEKIGEVHWIAVRYMELQKSGRNSRRK